MKRTLTIISITLLLAAAAYIPAQAAKSKPVSAVVAFVKGKLQVQPAGSKDWHALASGQFVNEGDTLKTGPASRASIVFAGGIETRLNSNSTFRIEEQGVDKASNASIIMSIGQVWTKILRKGTKFDVHTPVAVCSVRGTEYETDVNEHGDTDLKVFEGEVDFHNNYGHRYVKKDSKCSAHAGAAPGTPEPMGDKDKDNWHYEAGSSTTSKTALEVLTVNLAPEKDLTVKIKDEKGKPQELLLKFKPK